MSYTPLGLETDVANQNFSGAQNPDKLLHKEFYWHEPEDVNLTQVASEKAGKLVRVKGPKTIYVRIMRPGDQTSIIERAKVLQDEIRFPDEWRAFQITEGLVDRGENVPGWKIDEWDELSQEEIHRLKFLRFYTVEQIAGASDAQVGNIMGGLGLRKRAQDACKARATASVRAELDAKDAELAEMKKRMAALEAAILEKAPQVQEKKKRTLSPEHLAKLKAGREAKKQQQGA